MSLLLQGKAKEKTLLKKQEDKILAQGMGENPKANLCRQTCKDNPIKFNVAYCTNGSNLLQKISLLFILNLSITHAFFSFPSFLLLSPMPFLFFFLVLLFFSSQPRERLERDREMERIRENLREACGGLATVWGRQQRRGRWVTAQRQVTFFISMDMYRLPLGCDVAY
jgi:hypothetical protein